MRRLLFACAVAAVLLGVWPGETDVSARVAAGCDLPAAPTLEPGRLHEGPTDYGRHLQPLGTLRAVMLFIDFADAPAGAESTTALHDLFAPRTAAYYAEASHGRMTLEFVPQHRWYRMPSPASAYDMNTSRGRATWIFDAIRAADADVDFSRFQLFYIVSSPGAYEGVDPIFNPPGRGVVADGTELRHGVLLSASRRLRELPAAVVWGVAAHETGHVFGLPDLYLVDTRDESQRHLAVGGWDVMAFTSRLTSATTHFLAWHKRKLGWLDAAQVVCADAGPVEQALTPLEQPGGVKMLVAPTGPHTAYVAEARERTGFDAGICESGVLVYAVDTSVPSGSEPVRVKPARTEAGSCGPLSFAPFKAGGCFEDRSANLKLEVKSGFVVKVGPAGTPCAVADTMPPRVTLAAARAGSAALRVTVAANEACTVSLVVRARGAVIGRGRATLARAGRTSVTIRLRSKSRPVVVTATAVDRAGNRATVRITSRA